MKNISYLGVFKSALLHFGQFFFYSQKRVGAFMRQGYYKNTVYILLLHKRGIIEISSLIWFQWPIGFLARYFIAPVSMWAYERQNYMCHKQKE